MLRFYDVLDREYHWKLNELFTSVEFPWYFQRQAHSQSDALSVLSVGFTHLFVSGGKPNSDMEFVLNPLMEFLVEKFENVEMLRVQANLLLNHGRPYIGTIHTDGFNGYELDGKTWLSAVYYVSESDGDTVFFDERGFERERQSPMPNSMIVFKGKNPHAASLPINHPSRIVINMNMTVSSWSEIGTH